MYTIVFCLVVGLGLRT